MQHQWQPFSKWKPTHKYAINADYLGDQAQLAWSNLGYWDAQTQRYDVACRQLADRLADAIQLTRQDALIDLGCGQGASLAHWQQDYALQQLVGVELQGRCVEHIQQTLLSCPTLYTQSFLKLAQIPFKQPFDAVLCIDAAYHSALDLFLTSVTSVMKDRARLGFHYLVLAQPLQQLSRVQQQRYRYLLKAADINIDHLMTQTQLIEQLQQHQLSPIKIEDLSEAVLAGFANYVAQRDAPPLSQRFNFDYLKIKMTAQLCRHLYQDGLIRYVQISAVFHA